jgi:hypothetical protein
VSCNRPEHRRGIFLKLEDVASNDGVEGSLERDLARITFAEKHIPKRPGGRTLSRCFECCRNSIYADNLAFVAHDFRGKKGNIASASANVKHTHAGDDPSFTEEPLRYRIDKTRLRLEPFDLPIGMTQHVLGYRISIMTNTAHSSGLSMCGIDPSQLPDTVRLSARLGL